jgi:hypothetical protein
MAEPQLESRRHEASVVDSRAIAWFTFSLAMLTVVSAVAAYLLMGGFHPPRPATTALPAQSSAPGATAILQPAPAGDLHAYRRQKRAELERYGWADRKAGLAEIPIERAMQLMAARGKETLP